MIRKRGCFFAAAATKHIQVALRHLSTASASPVPPERECPSPKKPTKVALQPKRPRPSTPLSEFGKSRSCRFADAAAQRAAQDPNRQNMEQWRKLKKKEKKKKRETPVFEDLTVAKPAHSDLPFAFRYSYTEVPKVKPIGFREQYSPFGPGRLDRTWDGQEASPVPPADAPAPSLRKKERDNKKKIIDSFNPPTRKGIKPITEPGPFLPGTGPIRAKTREERLGEPLTKEETDMLVKHSHKIKKQLNIGRDGLTHNLLICIFDYWTRERVVRVKCMGVSTVDMDNIVLQIEDKTGGKVIQRAGGTLHVFRGRNYNNMDRPNIPKMLWRPHSPVYPKLVTDKPGGLKLMEANAFRKRGREILPLCRLAKNGYYGDLVANIREAFQEDDLVRIDCSAVERSDYKKIGAKLRDLVPCVLISFQNDQILIWKGRDRRQRRKKELPMLEAGSTPPGDGDVAVTAEAGSIPCGDGDVAENVEVAQATCEKAGGEVGEGKDDSCTDRGESSGVDDDGIADSCEDTDAFSASGDGSHVDTDSSSESEDHRVEDDPFSTNSSCEDEPLLNAKNVDEEV